MKATDFARTGCILQQGKALLRAIEGISELGSTGPFERAIARLLLAAYRRQP